LPMHSCQHVPELITMERALVLPHHHRVELPIRRLGSRQQPPTQPGGPSRANAATGPRRRTPPRSRRTRRPTPPTPPAATPAKSPDPGTRSSASGLRTRNATHRPICQTHDAAPPRAPPTAAANSTRLNLAMSPPPSAYRRDRNQPPRLTQMEPEATRTDQPDRQPAADPGTRVRGFTPRPNVSSVAPVERLCRPFHED
jgi:hypothetical protein